MTNLFSLTYFIVDSINMLKHFGQKYDQTEMFLHHFFGAGCISMSLFTGYGSVGGANMFLISELSTIFLKFCYLFPKD